MADILEMVARMRDEATPVVRKLRSEFESLGGSPGFKQTRSNFAEMNSVIGSLGKNVKDILNPALKGTGLSFVSLGAAMTSFFFVARNVSQTTTDMKLLADTTSFTVEQVRRLSAAGERIQIPQEQMQGFIERMATLARAKGGGPEGSDAWQWNEFFKFMQERGPVAQRVFVAMREYLDAHPGDGHGLLITFLRELSKMPEREQAILLSDMRINRAFVRLNETLAETPQRFQDNAQEAKNFQRSLNELSERGSEALTKLMQGPRRQLTRAYADLADLIRTALNTKSTKPEEKTTWRDVAGRLGHIFLGAPGLPEEGVTATEEGERVLKTGKGLLDYPFIGNKSVFPQVWNGPLPRPAPREAYPTTERQWPMLGEEQHKDATEKGTESGVIAAMRRWFGEMTGGGAGEAGRSMTGSRGNAMIAARARRGGISEGGVRVFPGRGPGIGGREPFSVPPGSPQSGERETVTLDNGLKLNVNKNAAPQLKALYNRLIAMGAPVTAVGGYGDRPHNWSAHPPGYATDWNQLSYGVMSARAAEWYRAHEKEIKEVTKALSIIEGRDFTDPDTGHFSVRKLMTRQQIEEALAALDKRKKAQTPTDRAVAKETAATKNEANATVTVDVGQDDPKGAAPSGTKKFRPTELHNPAPMGSNRDKDGLSSPYMPNLGFNW